MSAERTLLCALVIALTMPTPAAVAPDAINGITINDAKSLSDIEFAQRLMSLLSLNVVDVDRTSILHDQSVEVNVALAAKPVWKGVCGSRILQLKFPEESVPSKPSSPTDLDAVMFYKIRGNTDQNSPQNDATFQATCAADHPFRDRYFTAPDGRTAQAAGMIIKLVQSGSKRRRRLFKLSCHASGCQNALEPISKVSVEQMHKVDKREHCDAERTYITHHLFDTTYCLEHLSGVAQV